MIGQIKRMDSNKDYGFIQAHSDSDKEKKGNGGRDYFFHRDDLADPMDFLNLKGRFNSGYHVLVEFEPSEKNVGGILKRRAIQVREVQSESPQT